MVVVCLRERVKGFITEFKELWI